MRPDAIWRGECGALMMWSNGVNRWEPLESKAPAGQWQYFKMD